MLSTQSVRINLKYDNDSSRRSTLCYSILCLERVGDNACNKTSGLILFLKKAPEFEIVVSVTLLGALQSIKHGLVISN